MLYSCYIFDFDGTLADTQQAIVLTVQETMRLMGLTPSPIDAISATIGLPLTNSFIQHAHLSPDTAEEASRIYRSIFMQVSLHTITLFPGVEETLKALQRQGAILAIASSRSMVSLPQLVQYLHLDQYFPYVFGEEHAPHPKPAPDLVDTILKQVHADPYKTLVIGDTTFDLQMGSSAHCHTCGVTYGNHTRAQLQTCNPTLLVDSLTELLY